MSGVTIKELKKPKYRTIRMNCDELLHPKLEEYPMIKDAFSTNSFNIIVGSMGAGKTSWITNLVKHDFKKVFEYIILIMPESSRQSIDNDIFGKNLPPDQLYDDLNEGILTEIYGKLQEHTEEGYNTLLIIDDFQPRLKDPDVAKVLEKIIIKTRHLRCTTFYLVQNYQKIPKNIRELAMNLILFKLSKSSLLRIFEEAIQVKKEKFEAIIDLCFKDPHDWILINLHRSKNIYRNFDQVLF
jgi:hypothetical protein